MFKINKKMFNCKFSISLIIIIITAFPSLQIAITNSKTIYRWIWREYKFIRIFSRRIVCFIIAGTLITTCGVTNKWREKMRLFIPFQKLWIYYILVATLIRHKINSWPKWLCASSVIISSATWLGNSFER